MSADKADEFPRPMVAGRELRINDTLEHEVWGPITVRSFIRTTAEKSARFEVDRHTGDGSLFLELTEDELNEGVGETISVEVGSR